MKRRGFLAFILGLPLFRFIPCFKVPVNAETLYAHPAIRHRALTKTLKAVEARDLSRKILLRKMAEVGHDDERVARTVVEAVKAIRRV